MQGCAAMRLWGIEPTHPRCRCPPSSATGVDGEPDMITSGSFMDGE